MNVETYLRLRLALFAVLACLLWVCCGVSRGADVYFFNSAISGSIYIADAPGVNVRYSNVITPGWSFYCDSGESTALYVDFYDPVTTTTVFIGYIAVRGDNTYVLFNRDGVTVSSPSEPIATGGGVVGGGVSWDLVMRGLAAGFGFVILPMTMLIVVRKVRQGIALGGEI